VIVALAGLTAALQSAALPSPPPYDHLPPKEMRKVIETCGFTKVWVGRDKAKRSIVRVSDTIATDDQLTCAAKALDTTFYGSEFSPELAERFVPIRAAIARPRQLAEARARFAREPERGAPPERLPEESNIAVAKRVETFCGPVAKGALVEEAGSIKVSDDWMQQRSATPDAMVAMAATLGCIFQASVIAELELGGPGTGLAAD
jgi:hypothetical protein